MRLFGGISQQCVFMRSIFWLIFKPEKPVCIEVGVLISLCYANVCDKELASSEFRFLSLPLIILSQFKSTSVVVLPIMFFLEFFKSLFWYRSTRISCCFFYEKKVLNATHRNLCRVDLHHKMALKIYRVFSLVED